MPRTTTLEFSAAGRAVVLIHSNFKELCGWGGVEAPFRRCERRESVPYAVRFGFFGA